MDGAYASDRAAWRGSRRDRSSGPASRSPRTGSRSARTSERRSSRHHRLPSPRSRRTRWSRTPNGRRRGRRRPHLTGVIARDAGVVHQHVEAAESLLDPARRVADGGRIGDVEPNDVDTSKPSSSQVGGRLLAAVRITGTDHHRHTEPSEPGDDLAPDTSGTSGHQGDRSAVLSHGTSSTSARARDQVRLGQERYPAGMDLVETRELSYFVAVAEELHFGRAAKRLGMTQPPLSRAIRQLERRLGVPLLARTSRHVTLTAAGEVLLRDGQHALDSVAAAARRAQRAGLPARSLVLAMKAGTDGGLLPDILSAYRSGPGRAPGRGRPTASTSASRCSVMVAQTSRCSTRPATTCAGLDTEDVLVEGEIVRPPARSPPRHPYRGHARGPAGRGHPALARVRARPA